MTQSRILGDTREVGRMLKQLSAVDQARVEGVIIGIVTTREDSAPLNWLKTATPPGRLPDEKGGVVICAG